MTSAADRRPGDGAAAGLGRIARPRLYEQVAERLRQYVESAKLRAGDRLPPERELAERLGVSRTSVRQAMVALEVQGLVEVRHGGGSYLRRDHLDPEPIEQLMARRRRLPEVLEAREALETELAHLAALRRTEADLAELDAALAAMRAAVDRGEIGAVEDLRFHSAVTAAARNHLIAELMRHIAPRIAESRAESLRQVGRPAQSLDQLGAVADAIAAADPAAAAEAMRRHVRAVGQVRLLDWEPPAPG